MPQLHLYVPEETAERLRAQAKARKLSLSKYLAEIVQREARSGWPDGYFDQVAGAWVGDFDGPEELPFEDRDPL